MNVKALVGFTLAMIGLSALITEVIASWIEGKRPTYLTFGIGSLLVGVTMFLAQVEVE